MRLMLIDQVVHIAGIPQHSFCVYTKPLLHHEHVILYIVPDLLDIGISK